MRKFVVVLVCLLGMVFDLAASDKLSPVAIFSDNMVLQAGISVPVWGDAKAGEKVTVDFAGQKKSAKADENGYWMVKLDALAANQKPAVMTITSGKDKVEIKNAIVGEVWVCSGQSNMDYQVGGLKKQNGKPTPLIAEAEKANFPLLRQYSFKKVVSPKKPLRDFKGVWEICDPKTVDHFTATGFFFGRELLQTLNTPIGLIKVAWGGTPVEAWTRYEVLAQDERGKSYIPIWEKKAKEYNKDEAEKKFKEDTAKWEEEKKAAETASKKFTKRKPVKWRSPYQDPIKSSHYPSTLYNGMINPIVPYAIAGAIWYQGENNAGGQAKFYEGTFKAMITDWRKQWSQGDFPFYFVQLANFKKPYDKPREHGWATLRQCQFDTLSLPNTGMAVIIDIGEEKDIHPRNKVDVGKRLAFWALNKNYGKKNLTYSGPLYKSAAVSGNKITITFDEVGSGLMVGSKKDVWAPVEKSDAELAQFQIAGKDKKWRWAKAKITGKNTVEVWEDSIKAPMYVRYAWDVNPIGANLYNKELLPASPFTSLK